MLLLVYTAQFPALAENLDSEDGARNDTAGQPVNFPEWPPERPEPFAGRNFVPPPPGPYMSTALSEIENGFDTSERPHPPPARSAHFRPDAPWPARHHRPAPKRWLPKDGYHFAPPDAGERVGQESPPTYSGPAYYPPPGYSGWGQRQW